MAQIKTKIIFPPVRNFIALANSVMMLCFNFVILLQNKNLSSKSPKFKILMRQDNFVEKIPETKSEKFFTRPLIVIFVTIFIDLIGFGIAIPVLPDYAKNEFGASPFVIGWLVASYSIMQFVSTPFLGQLSDKYGRRPILLISLLGTSVAALITGLSTTLWLLFFGRIFDGITGGNISTAQAYIADVTTRENRAKGMGLIGAAFGLGFVFGPAIGGILSKFGPHAPFFFVSALAISNAVLLYFILPESRQPNTGAAAEKKSGRFAGLVDSLADSRFRLVTIIYFLVIVAFSIMTTVFVQYTAFRFGYTPEQNGYLFAYVGALAVVLQGGVFSRLVKAFGEISLIILGCLLLTGAFFAVPFVAPANGGLAALLVGVAFFSIGNSLSAPALTLLASKEAHDEEQGKTLGIMQSAASLARAIGPALSAFLLYSAAAPEHLSDYTLYRTFWTASAIMLVSVLIVVYFSRINKNQKIA
jgi:DHA1 family tetracycline resistance protein-like MFS transporter